jgi:hypothetical protein
MPLDVVTHFVFVDFENVQKVDLGLVEGKPVRVTLLIGKHQNRIDRDLFRQVHRLAAQVEIVDMASSGRNALDLTLACYLGREIERNPGGIFAVISKDKDFAPMIEHLRSNNIDVARFDTFSAPPFLRPAKIAAHPKSPASSRAAATATSQRPAEDRTAKVIARLKNPASRNRPATEKALLAHIRTALGKESSDARSDDILRELRDNGILNIDTTGKVVYPETR